MKNKCDDKFWATKVGLIVLPTGTCEIRKNSIDGLVKRLRTDFEIKGNKWLGCVETVQEIFGERIKLPKLEYYFQGRQASLEISLVTTKKLRKSVLWVNHLFKCSIEEFIKKHENVLNFFNFSNYLDKEVHETVLSYCLKGEILTEIAEIGEVSLNSIFVSNPNLSKGENDKNKEEFFEKQEKFADELMDEKIKAMENVQRVK